MIIIFSPQNTSFNNSHSIMLWGVYMGFTLVFPYHKSTNIKISRFSASKRSKITLKVTNCSSAS